MNRSLCFLALLLLLTALQAQAQVPLTLSYQGVLSDTDGNAAPDGTYTLTFTLYDNDTGGQTLWTEAQTVSITKGLFQVILGSVAPLNVPFDAPYWLGIRVDEEAEMAPRVALTASAYSLSSRVEVSEAAPGASFTVRDAGGTATHVLSPEGDVRHAGVGTFDGGIVVGDTTVVPFDTTETAGKQVLLPARGAGVQERTFGGRIGKDTDRAGVFGWSTASAPGVFGQSGRSEGVRGHSFHGIGVRGISVRSTGVGVLGSTHSGTGVRGEARSGTGVQGFSEEGTGVSGFSEEGTGVSGESPDSVGVSGFSQEGTGVRGESPAGIGVNGVSRDAVGVRGFSTLSAGVMGLSLFQAGGFFQGSPAGRFEGTLEIIGGIEETSRLFIEVLEEDPEEEQFLVWSDDQFVRWRTLPAGSGGDSGWTLDTATNTVSTNHTVSVTHPTRGFMLAADPEEGEFKVTDPFGQAYTTFGQQGIEIIDFTGSTVGELTFQGEAFFESLTAQTKNFRIDHPLDPQGKYLQHVSVESPDMKTFYDDTVTTDAEGYATVEMPAYFEALNRDFRYQLTVIGQFARVIVAQEIEDRRFVIQTDKPRVKVSWQVTGIRHDAYAEQHRVPVELDKPPQD